MPTSYLERYLPILIHATLAVIIGGAMLALSTLIGRHKPSRVKGMPYESGVPPVGELTASSDERKVLSGGDALSSCSDVEAVFPVSLGPWFSGSSGMFGFMEMVLYMAFIMAGFFYIWKRGVFDWSKD